MKITLRFGTSFLISLLTAMAFSCSVKAQSDNFDDGDDTANPAWTHYDPIGDSIGGTYGAWTLPGGNAYRLQAFASPDPPGQGWQMLEADRRCRREASRLHTYRQLNHQWGHNGSKPDWRCHRHRQNCQIGPLQNRKKP